MRILAINHQRDAGPGVFADAVAAAGAELDHWFRAETGTPPADPASYDAVMTFGGSMHVDQQTEHPWLDDERSLLRELLERGTPLLGACLGAQLLSEAAGGDAHRAPHPELGWFEVEVTAAGAADPVIGPLAPGFTGLEWHSYACGVPDHAAVLARTPGFTQAFRVGDRAWGIQFHAEVSVADIERWIDGYRADGDVARFGVDPEVLRAETLPRMAAWNELGRELCARFVAAAAATRRPSAASSSSR